MSILDELKRLAKPYDDDDDFGDEDEEAEETAADEAEEEEAPAPRQVRRAAAAAPAARPARAAAPAAAAAPVAPAAQVVTAPAAPRVTSPMQAFSNNTGKALKMVLVKPELYEDVCKVADHLRANSAVVLNLENTDNNSARRLVDFLSGCAYIMDGNIKKIATSTYVITPSNVDVVGELTPENTGAEEESETVSY